MGQWISSFPIFQAEAAFPELTEAQIEDIRPFGEEIDYPEGTYLYRRGDRDIDFFVILGGTVEVSGADRHGNKEVFGAHQARGFTGELNLICNSKSLVDARAAGPLQVLRVKHKDLRRLLAVETALGEILTRAFVVRRENFLRIGQAGITLFGFGREPNTLRIRQFLNRTGYPHELVDPGASPFPIRPEDLPVVWDGKGTPLKNPSLLELSRELGVVEEIPLDHDFDLAIVGAGPAGLAASVYGASEGMRTVLLDAIGPGGQAGESSLIENYLGFPIGISGQELATRAQVQAVKFGVHFSMARNVTGIRRTEDGLFELVLSDLSRIRTRAAIVASGAKYQKLNVPASPGFDGYGIHYAATAIEAELCRDEETIIVGGGNSAGQAAVLLSRGCSKVHLLVRSKNLSATMSKYLIERISLSPRIQVHFETEIVRFIGTKDLESVEWKSKSEKSSKTLPIRTVFVMIGAAPNTDWLKGFVELDAKGFVRTGSSPFQTSQPGIFAVGDVRSGSVKRIASAVGEGSVVLQGVREYLDAPARPEILSGLRTAVRKEQPGKSQAAPL